MDKRKLAFCMLLIWINASEIESTNEEEPSVEENSNEANDGEVLSLSESFCVEFKGAYARKNNVGVVCCGNNTLYLPFLLTDNFDTNSILDHCTIKATNQNEADFPTTLWNIPICLLRNASAFGEKLTFDGYFDFVTHHYPDDIKKEIKAGTDACKAEADNASTDTKKMQKYTECLHKSEKQVCHKPYATSVYEELNKKQDDNKYACPGLEGVYGPDRVDFCCKKESIPYNFFEFFMHFPSDLDGSKSEKTVNCSRSFVNRQIELNPKLKKALESLAANDDMSETEENAYEDEASKLNHCPFACSFMQTSFSSSKELTIPYDKAVDAMMSVFGSKIRNDLKSIAMGRKSVAVFHVGNSSLTHDEYVKKFESADELTRIHLYCDFYSNVLTEVDRALHEYCFDKDFADGWLNSHWKQIIGDNTGT